MRPRRLQLSSSALLTPRNSAAGAKYTRAAVKYTALILAFKLAALAAFALKVGPEL